MQSFVGKFIAIIAVAIGLMYGYKLYQQNQDHQQQLNAEISELKNMLSAQDDQQQVVMQEVVAQKQEMLSAVEAQKAEAQKQLEESKKQSEILEQQVDQMTEVVTQMEEERQREEAREAEMEAFSQNNLRAAYISTGLQAAATFKVQIAQYRSMHNVFPNSNAALGLRSPKSYATDVIRSITVSQGGKITVVYTEKTGQDRGAITLKPTLKNHQINWTCKTRDFSYIQNFMPDCRFQG